MSCLECEPRAEECWEFDQASDEYGVNVEPCTCPCHKEVDYYRASGRMICGRCGKEYRKHPRGGPIGMDDQRFLRRLCNGDLVKL